MHHVRAAGMCGPGLRLWAAHAQVDLRKFCREGLLIEDHPHLIDDPFVVRALAAASEEENQGE
jgi:hypothetical protein